MVQKFYEKCIQIRDRKTKELRRATLAEIAILIRKIKTPDLYEFYRECERANHFAKYFWWALRNKV
jgi:hypothetical protein